MKPLGELAAALVGARLIGDADTPVAAIQFDIRKVRRGSLFVAIRGFQDDGHHDIARAIGAGAGAILCARIEGSPVPGVAYLVVPDPIEAMGRMAHAFHDHPSRRLRVVGVTGTNGKTTTATLLHGTFRTLGHRVGLLSTVRNLADDEELEWSHTTSHALQISAHMARMAAAGCTHCFMEVTSQSVDQNRLAGIAFDGGVFTNLTHDHLDYHGTLDGYALAKKGFFDGLPAAAFALANADDPRGRWMLGNSAARLRLYGAGAECDYRLAVVADGLDGLRIGLNGHAVASPLIGTFNAHNLAACLGAACELGEDPAAVAVAMATVPPVDGRMQRITAPDGRVAIVDYAHSPDAVEKVLAALTAVRPGGRIIAVLGCGGDCDTAKRPIMGRAAALHSDRVFLTSDNPRTEDPASIIAQMAAGVPALHRDRLTAIVDRRAAILAACAAAGPDDVVLIAGKGHESDQDIGGVRLPFDDADVAREALGTPREWIASGR